MAVSSRQGNRWNLFYDEVTKVDTARHCVLYEATGRKADKSEPITLDTWRKESTYTVGDKDLSICSYPGVFSHEKLDDGTRMLLETITEIPNGRVLDFGCGCGIIGAWAHSCNKDARIEMIDSNSLAIEAARETAKINGMSADCVYPSNVFSDVTGEFDLILSNPPFHTGIETNYEISEEFFTVAAARLTNNGRLRIVANRFLPYHKMIKKFVGPCRTIAEDKRYRVYEAIRQSD